MAVTAEQFRGVMAEFATGVTVVTGRDENGEPVGFTANAVCSVSLEPPLLLICADLGSKSLAALLGAGRFAVSVLGAKDGRLALQFADGARSDRFRGLDLRGDGDDPPILAAALAWMRCEVRRNLDAGDHTIVIGEVRECGSTDAGAPLVFFRGRFSTVADLPRSPDG